VTIKFLSEVIVSWKGRLLFFLLLFSGCVPLSSPKLRGDGVEQWTHLNARQIESRLRGQYSHWRGVNYRLGGLSKSGVDCSGFVMLTFRDKFAINLPRTAELQVSLGKSIRQKNIQAGDLIFFKTAIFTRHVGIYMGDGRFLHASTSKGVTVSRLDNPYWKSSYWVARRL